MNIVFFGSKDRAVLCLEELLKHKWINVVGAVTYEDTDKHKFWKESLWDYTIKKNIELFHPASLSAPAFLRNLKDKDAELFVLCGYNRIVPKEVITIPEKGTINLHAGRLPEYRGGSTMNWMIINGEKRGSAEILYVTDKIDDGDVLAQKSFPINADDTIEDVRIKVNSIFPKLLYKTILNIANNTVIRHPQNEERACYYCSRQPQDGCINWQYMTAKQVYDFVRALTHPYPGAFTYYRGQKLYIWKASLLDNTIKHMPGKICLTRAKGMVVMAKDKCLLVEKVQFDGIDKEQDACECLQRGEYLGV